MLSFERKDGRVMKGCPFRPEIIVPRPHDDDDASLFFKNAAQQQEQHSSIKWDPSHSVIIV